MISEAHCLFSKRQVFGNYLVAYHLIQTKQNITIRANQFSGETCNSAYIFADMNCVVREGGLELLEAGEP